jgi:hypothetical protein
MARRTLCSIAALTALVCAFISMSAAQAEPAASDLTPDISSIAPSAFRNNSPSGQTDADTHTLETGALRAPGLFTDLLMRWETSDTDHPNTQVEVRVSEDGATWSKWGVVAVSDDPASPDEPVGTRWSDPMYAHAARLYQLRVTLRRLPDGTMPQLRNLQVHTVDADETAPAPEITRSISRAATVAQPAYVSRTSWGSPDGEGSRVKINRRPVTHLVVHHTADSSSLSSAEPNWAARVRAYWSFHAISRGWGDIGYNWLIDPNGVIYAGRAGSTADTAEGGAVGFHDTANFGSMGVSVIGTYTSATPTTAAQNSLVNLLAWKAGQRDIDPNGSGYYYGCAISSYCNKYNSGANVPRIAGHRQVTPGHTTCPGDAFMALMPQLKQRVANVLNGGAKPDDGNGIVDELEPGFRSGTTNWYTYTTDKASESTNWGEWRPKLQRSGQYKLRVHVPQGCNIFTGREYATRKASYEINHAGGKTRVTVDQTTSQSYVEFGPFQFNAGDSGYVRLTDLTGEPYSADNTKKTVIFFDAVEWLYQQQNISAQLISAKLTGPTTIPFGGAATVEFTIKNTGDTPIETQGPDGGAVGVNGWTYDEGECFANSANSSFPKEAGRLRATLGFSEDSAKVRDLCAVANGDYPWRWGLKQPLAPGETRTIVGAVRFRTPGTYKLEANLVNEYVRYFGSDSNGASFTVGSITVEGPSEFRFLPAATR